MLFIIIMSVSEKQTDKFDIKNPQYPEEKMEWEWHFLIYPISQFFDCFRACKVSVECSNGCTCSR